MARKFKFRQGEVICVTKGNFKNVCGSVNHRERQRKTPYKYYDIHASFKIKRNKYDKSLSDSGLGGVVNILEEHLKKDPS
mgnify:CR=1 FL=1